MMTGTSELVRWVVIPLFRFEEDVCTRVLEAGELRSQNFRSDVFCRSAGRGLVIVRRPFCQFAVPEGPSFFEFKKVRPVPCHEMGHSMAKMVAHEYLSCFVEETRTLARLGQGETFWGSSCVYGDHFLIYQLH